MTDQLSPFTLRDLIAEVEREIALRKKWYPIWVQEGRVSVKRAELQLALMRGVLKKLEQIQDGSAGPAPVPQGKPD